MVKSGDTLWFNFYIISNKKKFSCNISVIEKNRMVLLFQAPGNWLIITLNNTNL